MSARPEILFPLFAALTGLDSVGPKKVLNMVGLGVEKPRDLLFLLPFSGIDRALKNSVQGADLPSTLTVEVEIGQHRAPRNKGGAYRIDVIDQQITFQLVYFRARGDYLSKLLPTGQRRIVSGKVELFDGLAQMLHPDHVVSVENAARIPSFEPVYPLTAGVTQKTLSKAIRSALERVPKLEEWIDPSRKSQKNWPSWSDAIQLVHKPVNTTDLAQSAPARERLAYDEFMAHQLTLALARVNRRRAPGIESYGTGKLRNQVLSTLPYKPTGAQLRAINEIIADMASGHRMNRLLQGDVGSGKTLVAFMALLTAVEAGGQGVMMTPTEILARQHFEGLQPLAEDAGVILELLTGRDKGKERTAKLTALRDGRIQILVGTHAVFQKNVQFSNLCLAIIDEQHRFGVRQRLELGEKGKNADVLMMTATPIPRSLALAQYGDMDVSVLDEKPAGRQPIKTALISDERVSEVVDHLRKAITEDKQAYWVCPLVGESEVSDLIAAEERFKTLCGLLGEAAVRLVHGQMSPAEKDSAMADFIAGKVQVLVATTVIEVGVNVPNATIMVIERAESFGLAQLHQLRGRVGRGSSASTCLLMYNAPLSENGQKKLKVLRETEDGFVISETDLHMRGAGNLIGTLQSGLPHFRIADMENQTALMDIAQSDARKLLNDDPDLTTSRGKAARVLLCLMEQDQAIRFISVG